MQLIINPGGGMRHIYDEALELSELGHAAIARASHVEPDAAGAWWVDLSPVAGPCMGPFECRSAALKAEVDWLNAHLHELSL